MSEKLTEIIQPDKFVSISSSALINRLCQPHHLPTDEEVASLVAKYFWRYHKPTSKEGDLSDITALMQIMEYYFAHRNFTGATFDFGKLPGVVLPIFEFLKKHEYAVGMLGDVSSTSAIVKSIILQNLDVGKSAEFYGIDIGTGSGILALAQYILARRNGARSIRIDGLEQSVRVARQAEETLRSFVPGGTFHVHGADATRDNAYKKIPGVPNFVSIEMLPYTGAEMIIRSQEESGRNTHVDPFMPSVFALCRKFSNLTRIATFPQSLRLQVSLSRENENGFIDTSLSGTGGLFDIARFGADNMASQIAHMKAYGIRLSEKQEPQLLSDVGSYMLQTPDNPDGWIKLFPIWLYRWKNMTRYNPTYRNLLDLYFSGSVEKRASVPVLLPLRWADTVTR